MTLNTESLTTADSRHARAGAIFVAALVSAAVAFGIAMSELPSYAVALALTGAATLYALRLRWRD